MLAAFNAIGCEVVKVCGYSKNRKKEIAKLLQHGELSEFTLCYSENSTSPLALNDLDHLPRLPSVDAQLFSSLKRYSIPIGVFYRDAYWKFPSYDQSGFGLKRIVAKLFYQSELRLYKKYATKLFLPSLEMGKYLPEIPPQMIDELPPGADYIECPPQQRQLPLGEVRLLYVGGIIPPLYDLSPLFSMINEIDHITLTVICRREEWSKYASFYPQATQSQKIRIIHANGAELADYYRNSDIFVCLRNNSEYLDFAFPVKILEATAFGTPILTMGKNPASRFVEANRIGWVVDDIVDAKKMLLQAQQGHIELHTVREHVLEVARINTWEKRAQYVISSLDKKRGAEIDSIPGK